MQRRVCLWNFYIKRLLSWNSEIFLSQKLSEGNHIKLGALCVILGQSKIRKLKQRSISLNKQRLQWYWRDKGESAKVFRSSEIPERVKVELLSTSQSQHCIVRISSYCVDWILPTWPLTEHGNVWLHHVMQTAVKNGSLCCCCWT